MSEKQEDGGSREPTPTTGTVTNTNPTNSGEESSSYNNNVISLATKEISDVIHFQGPSTSKSYHLKTEIRINITGEDNNVALDGNDSQHLSLFETNVETLKLKKGAVDIEESYATVDACFKEKMTETAEVVTFSRNDRTQRIVAANSEAPPPYESQAPPAYSREEYYTSSNAAPRTIGFGDHGGGGYSEYDSTRYSGDFIFPRTRQKFIKKVFTILFVQLMITTAFVLLAMFHEKTKQFMLKHVFLFWAMTVIEMILLITLMCSPRLRRTFPLNFFVLFLFTLSLSYICAFATLFYATNIIVLSAGCTGMICLLVTLLACQPWFDITKWSFIIALSSILLMIFGLVVMVVSLFTYWNVLWLVYSASVVVMFTVFMLYDMQCILGGRWFEISPEEYIFAALLVYIDIIIIFLYLLELIQRARQ